MPQPVDGHELALLGQLDHQPADERGVAGDAQLLLQLASHRGLEVGVGCPDVPRAGQVPGAGVGVLGEAAALPEGAAEGLDDHPQRAVQERAVGVHLGAPAMLQDAVLGVDDY